MNTTLTLIDLAGTVALLIWGVHMVQTGVHHAFGPHIRRVLSYAVGNRLKAFAIGLGLRQSCKAVWPPANGHIVCGGRAS